MPETRQRKRAAAAAVKEAANNDATPVAAPAPAADKKKSTLEKMIVRSVVASCMCAVFAGVIAVGHLALCFMVVAVQFGVFRELVDLRYKEAKERSMPHFRSLQWAWFMAAMAWSYGMAWLKAPMANHELLDDIRRQLRDSEWVTDEFALMDALGFGSYACVFVLSVLSLKKGQYGYQIKQMSWTLVSVTLVVVQLKMAVHCIYEGMLWLLFPASLVIANDTLAYFVGVSIGGRCTKKQFMALSPNKTWEGFLGAGLLTMCYAFFFVDKWGSVNWVRCSYPEVYSGQSLELGSCHNDAIWTPYDNAPYLSKMKVIALGMALFASLVAPFGGFLASAIKRAFHKKDFATFLPGHGGMMDRMDCQLMMNIFSWVVFSTFVSNPIELLPVNRVIEVALRLSDADKLLVVDAIQKAMA